MTLPFQHNNKIAFHLMYKCQYLGDEIYEYNFFSSIPLSYIESLAPHLLSKILEPIKKEEKYIIKLLMKLGEKILQEEKSTSLFYPSYILSENSINNYVFTEYIRALQHDDWQTNTLFSKETNQIKFAAFSCVFKSYYLTDKSYINETFDTISRTVFENSINHHETSKQYTDLFSHRNLYLASKSGDILLLLNQASEPELLLLK